MGEKIEIPSALYEKVQKRIEGSEFRSVSDYIAFVLTEVLAPEDEPPEEEKSDVKDRLRSLGYMD